MTRPVTLGQVDVAERDVGAGAGTGVPELHDADRLVPGHEGKDLQQPRVDRARGELPAGQRGHRDLRVVERRGAGGLPVGQVGAELGTCIPVAPLRSITRTVTRNGPEPKDARTAEPRRWRGYCRTGSGHTRGLDYDGGAGRDLRGSTRPRTVRARGTRAP